MAQIKIRKFSPGGVLRTETGETFTLAEVEQFARENPSNENLKDIVNELRAGNDVTHDISGNWSSEKSDDFTAGQQRRIAKNPNSFARRLAATFNTHVDQYGEDVSETTKILSRAISEKTPPTSSSTTPVTTPIDYTLISAASGERFVYDPETGTYVNGDFTNAKLMSLLDNIDAYLSNTDPAKKYKFKGLPLSTRDVLKKMYATNPLMIKQLMQKVQNGQIIEGSPEATLLLQLGIGSNMTKGELEQSQKDKALVDYFVSKGFSQDQFKGILPFVELDEQGLRLKAGVSGSPFQYGQNYYFNDQYNREFKDLFKGQILFNNRFYDAEQLAKSGLISEWVKLLREHKFKEADALIKWDWSNMADKYDYQLLPDDVYSEFLNGKRFLDVTGQYEKQYDEYGKPYQIIGYYDPNDERNYTSLGFVDPSKIKYARFNSLGHLDTEDFNIATLRKTMNPWEHKTVFPGRDASGNVQMPTLTTREGYSILGMDVKHNPEMGTVSFSGTMIADILGAGYGDTIMLDGEVAQILSSEFFNTLDSADPKLIKKFRDTILSLVGDKVGNAIRNQLTLEDWKRLLEPTYGKDADKYATMLYNYVKTYIGTPDSVWATAGAGAAAGAGIGSAFGGVGAIPGWVIGGVGGALSGLFANQSQISQEERLNKFTPKHQHGGLFTGSAMPVSSAPKIMQSRNYMPASTEEAGALDFERFTDADWMELAGLGADLSSVVTGVTGASIPSALLGFAGTGASFLADVKRDGFQTKDLGSLGLGLLFDAASLIPFAGTAAATGGVINKLRKGLPVLMKLAGVAGITSSFSLAVNKIQSGEPLTMRDLRVIMNGVLGTYTLAKQGVDITNRRAKDGVTIDTDIQKMHKDQIDSSNLSDGQKAALKHFFDGEDYSAGLVGEQAELYKQFLQDGGDEIALKMLIGENDLFKQLRSDRVLLDKVKRIISNNGTNGEALTSDEIKRYNEIIQESGLRSKLGIKEYEDILNLDDRNKELAELLRKSLDPNTPPDVKAEIDAKIKAFEDDTETYGEFFKKWNKLPSQSRYERLNEMIKDVSDDAEFHPGMFEKKNDFFAQDRKWAAGVAERNRIVDSVLNDGEATKALGELKTANQKVQELTASGAPKDQIDAATAVQSAAQAKAQQYIDKLEVLKSTGDVEGDVTVGYKKSLKLKKDVRTLNDQFKPVDGVDKAGKIREDLKELSEDSSKALLLSDRKTQGETLINDYLSATGSKKITRKVDLMVEEDFSKLTPEERARVKQILNKDWSTISDAEKAADIELLNYYTSRQNDAVDAIEGVAKSRANTVRAKGASEQINLPENIDLDKATILLRNAGLPKSVKLTETEWAQVKRSSNQREALREVLKKKPGVTNNLISKLEKELFTEVKKSDKPERTWYGKKKKNSDPDASEDTSPDFKLKRERFKTDYTDDNTLKGKILGRSKEQREYMDDLYGFSRRSNLTEYPRSTRKRAHRYYQPMVHGLHYNLMRDPVHYTPQYDPKEIRIVIDEEEE